MWEQNVRQGWELCYCDPIVDPHLGDLWPQVDLWLPVLVSLVIWIFGAIFGSQRYLAIKIIQELTLCDLRVQNYQRSNCFLCLDGRTDFFFVSVCQTTSDHEVKGKILIKYANLGRYGPKKKCQYYDKYDRALCALWGKPTPASIRHPVIKL